jgi:hypothetical protein
MRKEVVCNRLAWWQQRFRQRKRRRAARTPKPLRGGFCASAWEHRNQAGWLKTHAETRRRRDFSTWTRPEAVEGAARAPNGPWGTHLPPICALPDGRPCLAAAGTPSGVRHFALPAGGVARSSLNHRLQALKPSASVVAAAEQVWVVGMVRWHPCRGASGLCWGPVVSLRSTTGYKL